MAACSEKPTIGIESILASTGLHQALIEHAHASFEVVAGEDRELIEQLAKGTLDLAITNNEPEIDAMLRSGALASAEPVFHGEIVLVGPEKDPLGLHAERSLLNALRMMIEGEGAFFQCVPCGTRSRADTLLNGNHLPTKRNAFLDVGKNEGEIIRAMQHAPGYGFLSRPTVIRSMKSKEWSFRPLWSGDALQVDTYRVVVRPAEKIEASRREAIDAFKKWLVSDAARALIDKHGVEQLGQPYYRAGAPLPGEGAKFTIAR